MTRPVEIEDIYPLSPMQQGMLFESLYSPEAGLYLELFGRTIKGSIDVPVMKQVWQKVIDRHPIFRTSFIWQKGRDPFQVVHRRKQIIWRELDWTSMPLEEQTKRLGELYKEEGGRGFVLSQAPLMRIVFIHLGPDLYYFLWVHHHLLLDGWSVSLVLNEMAAHYEADTGGRQAELDRPRPYRDYIDWLQKQDLSKAEAFWKELLNGFTSPTPIGTGLRSDSVPARADTYRAIQVRMSEEKTARLQSFSRGLHLTFNTLVQGAWAVLLSLYSGMSSVVFGMVVSGRPPELRGVESMIGLFINVLPVRVRVPADEPIAGWLAELQQHLLELRQYEHSPLLQVQGWSEVPRGTPLFESVLIFENYPVSQAMSSVKRSESTFDLHSVERANVPLALVIEPGAELSLALRYDSRRFESATIRRILDHFQHLLDSMAERPEDILSSLSLTSEQDMAQLTDAFMADLG
ncbi:MAG: condensation domain-containing protein [Blastocatellia bacterium]